MSTLRVFSTPRGYHKYTGGYQDACGGYHEYTRRCSVHRRDTMSTLRGVQYTGGIPSVHLGILVQMGKDHYQISRIFVQAPFATMQLYMLAFGTSDSLLKFLYQVARAQTLTHLFLVSSLIKSL